MKLEELKKAILELSSEDRLRLMQEVGPELCESIMRDPKAIANMTRFCRWMMSGSPQMEEHMGRMVSEMFGSSRGERST